MGRLEGIVAEEHDDVSPVDASFDTRCGSAE